MVAIGWRRAKISYIRCIMNIAENLLKNCKYNEKLADYEAFADYLNTHKGEVTDISGVNIIKLLSTKAAKRQLSQHAENYEAHINEIEKLLSQSKPMPKDAEILRQAGKALEIGMNWNVTFEERDLAKFIQDAGDTPNVAIFTQKLPEGLNISEVQRMAGRRACLAGVDAGGCYMDSRDYAALPTAWKPDVSPILKKEDKVIAPAIKIDPDMAMIASATFSILNPTEKEAAQLQTILSKRMTIDQEKGMEAIVNIMAELQKKGKAALPKMLEEAEQELTNFKGSENVKKMSENIITI